MSEDLINAPPAKTGKRAATSIAAAAPEPTEALAPIDAIEAATEAVVAAVAETPETMVEAVADAAVVEAEGVAETVETVIGAAVETVAEIPEVAPTPRLPDAISLGTACVTTTAKRLQALSAASTALSLGVQEASRTWVSATQSGMKLQRDGFRRLAACRTPLDLIAAQGDLTLKGVETLMETGQSIARTSTKAVSEAGDALRG